MSSLDLTFDERTDYIGAVLCVIFAGLASGLTQGLLSLDLMELQIKVASGTPIEKSCAARIIPVISNHHLLLVTLMLWNALATEALPIFLNGLVSEYEAILISVTLVLLFGEIIPASILTGPNQLKITAFFTPLVNLVLFLLYPIAFPISKILDYIIGHSDGPPVYNRREIATMMQIQHEESLRRGYKDSIQRDEVVIIGGALRYRNMQVNEIMIPRDKCYMLSSKSTLSVQVRLLNMQSSN